MTQNDEGSRPEWVCEACGDEPAVIAGAMPYMPITVAYGRACLDANAYPYGLLVANTACLGGLELTGEGWQQMVMDTLAHLGKTQRQFDADVADAAMQVFEQMMVEAEQESDEGE